MTCGEMKAQLVDFLYDELSPGKRAAFAQHLEGCAACKAEVASVEKALGLARAALAGPLAQDPPANVRATILQAARSASAGTEQPSPVAPRSRASAASADGFTHGFFVRLLRAPWFLPAFGAASIATVVFLVRVLRNPEVLPGQQPGAIEERSVEMPKPAVEPAGNEDNERGGARKNSQEARENAQGERRAAGSENRSGRAATRKAHPQYRHLTDDPLSGIGAAADTSRPLRKDSDRFAEPPSAPAPAAAAKPASAAAPAPLRRAREAAAPASAMGGDDAETARGQAKASPPREEADPEATPSLAESLRRADRLFASQDWNAAADAYGDLVRRFAGHKDVPKWRDRMNAASVAYQRSLEAKRKKAASDDPLSGSKL